MGGVAQHTKAMNKKGLILALAMGLALTPACTDLTNLNSVSPNSVGAVSQLIPGTVVAARTVQIEADSTQKNLGTGFGAALGAGAGSLLGRGKGNVVSTVGFGIAGAALGRAVGNQVGKRAGQQLTIQADRTGKQYTVTQPIYQQIGAIPVGTHGNLQYGSVSKFLPDGF